MAGVALEAPAFLHVILDTEMAPEAFETEVDLIVLAFVFQVDFVGETVLVILVAHAHHDHEYALHGAH